jgi:hypothetical protein
MYKTPVSTIKTPDWSNIYNAPAYGASDPFVAYTATQPVLFYRSFFSNIDKDSTARSGVLPDVSLAAINNIANWSTTPTTEDFGSFIKLSYLAQGENPGLIGRDVEKYAQERAIMGQGVAPYNSLGKVILENLTPEQIRQQADLYALESELAKNDPSALIDPETGERYYLDMQGRKVPALQIGGSIVSQKLLEPLSKTMLERGMLYRVNSSMKGEASLPSLISSGAMDLNEYLDPTQGMLGISTTIPGELGASRNVDLQEQINDLLGSVGVAQYSNSINPLDVSGISDDIKKALEPTQEEKDNGFDGVDWFKKSINPEVVPFLAQKGISENLVRYARGHREALYFIQKELSTSTIQERIERYTRDASWWKTTPITQIGYSFPTMIINDPDAALALEISATTAGLGSILSAGVAGLSSIKRGAQFIKAASKVAAASKIKPAVKGLYQLSMGDLPIWFRNRGNLEKLGITMGIGAAQNAGASLRGQIDRIAWANTTLLTDNTEQINISELATAAGLGAAFGGILGSPLLFAGKSHTLDASGALVDSEGNNRSMVGLTPDQSIPIREGLEAAIEANTVNQADKPTDVLEKTNENVKDDGVTIVDTSGKKTTVREDDIFEVFEVDREKVLSGEYKLVRNTRTNTDVLVREDAIVAAQPKETPTVTAEEPKLTKIESTTIDSEKFADAADISTKAKREDGLVKASESTAFNRVEGESDESYAVRAINAGEVNTPSDFLRIISGPPTAARTTLGKLVEFRRTLENAKALLGKITHNRGDEWTKSTIESIQRLEQGELQKAIEKAMNAGDNAFTRLPETRKQAMVNFVLQHAGKSDDEIDRLIKESKDLFNRNEKSMLGRRLKTKKTKAERRKLIDEILSDKSISEQSRKILNVLIGTPENLTLLQRKAASKAFRKEKYFNQKATYLTGEFYLDVKSVITEAFNKLTPSQRNIAKSDYDLVLSLMRGALVNLKLPERAGLTKINLKLDNLGKNTFGSNKLEINPDGSSSLTITLDTNKLIKALVEGDNTLITHTILHELGHAYSYFATPRDILRMMVMYTEFLDPAVLSAFVDLTDQIRSRGIDNQVGLYGAINPGEVFANYFANRGIATSLDVMARLKLSFLEAFTSYVSEVIEGIFQSFTFNKTTQRKLKNISKVFDNIIKDISESYSVDILTMNLIDMTKVERTFTKALVNMSFYNKNRTTYLSNLENLINTGFLEKRQGTRTKRVFIGGIDTVVIDKDGYSEVIDEILKNENPDLFNNQDFTDFWASLDGLEKYTILKNPNEMLKIQLSSKYFSDQSFPILFNALLSSNLEQAKQKIYDIVQLAELTSTRIAFERFLNNRSKKAFTSNAELQKAIEEQGSYISANLNRYLSSKLFIETQGFDNWTLLTKLLEHSKSKEILRKNTFELSNERVVYRPKFDTGLDETSLILYHGGTWTGEKSPVMLHAGTLKAALDRVKNLIGYYDEYNMVAFEISREANIIELVDTGTQHGDFESYWSGIQNAYNIKPDSSIEQVIREIVVNRKKAEEIISELKRKSQYYQSTGKDLQKLLKEVGVDIIKYKNIAEDMGSTSFIIVNPRVINVKANGKFDSQTGVWQWKSRSTGKVLENTTKDLLDINYRGSESLENIISLLPDLKEIVTDFSEAISVKKDIDFTPTSITEVTNETLPNLIKELDSMMVKLDQLPNSFYKRLAFGLTKKTGKKFNINDTKDVLVDIFLASRKRLDNKEVPVILTVDSETSLFRLLFQFKKLGTFADLSAQAKRGKVVSLETLTEGKATEEGVGLVELDEEVMAGMANKNNEPTGEGELPIDKKRQQRSDYQNWLDTKITKYGNEVIKDLKNLIEIRFELSKLKKGYKPGETPKLPAGTGLELYFQKFPEERAVYNEALKATDKETVEIIKKKSTKLVTKIQKLEKKLLAEFKDVADKPIESEAILHNAVLEKVATAEEPVQTIQETKTENIQKDVIQAEENASTITAKEEVPEIAAPIIRGIGEKESFMSSNWDGSLEALDLGGIFTTEKKAAGLRRKLKGRYTTRVELDKSRVLKVVSSAPSVLQSVKNLPEPILRLAGINKSIMERVLGAIQKEHSEQEALRVVLFKLKEEGYTAIELIDKNGNLIGHVPTSKDHIKVIERVDHEKPKATGYVSVEALRKNKVEEVPEKVTIETEPTPVINPEELPVKTKDGESLEKAQEIEPGPSDVPVISEEERFVHSVLNATESLRWNGTTPKFIKIALIKFMKQAKELRENIGQTLTGIPQEFNSVLYKVLRVAEEIAEENRNRFGDLYEQINDEFWTIFDREVAKELVARGNLTKELSMKSLNEILTFAHTKVNENIRLRNQRDGLNLPEYLKPLHPNDFNFTVSSVTNKYPDGVEFRENSLAYTANRNLERKLKAEEPRVVTEKPKEMDIDEVERVVLDAISNKPTDNTMLLRESNFIGRIFGGSNRTNANWWRRLINGARNLIEYRTESKHTVHSISNRVRTLAAWIDPSKAHLHSLVGGGKNAFKSWEAIGHEVTRMTGELRNIIAPFIREVPSEKIVENVFIEVMKALGSKSTLNRNIIEAAVAIAIPSPRPELVNKTFDYAQKLYGAVVGLNKKILDLENETGWIELKDKQGNPVNPTEYFPITFIGERVLPQNRDQIIKALVGVRRETLLNSDDLSTDIMLSMGWLFDNSDDPQAGILDKGREVEGRRIHFLTEANFDQQTLRNLEVARYAPGSDARTFAQMAGEASKKHFVYKDSNTGELVVCLIPRKKADLSLPDLAKYNEVLDGSTNHIGKQWKANFPGNPVSPLYTIMSEYLDSKLYQGRYSKHLASRRGNPLSPMTLLRDRNRIEYGIAVKPLTWDELLKSDVLLKITRNDPLEAYSNFLKSRGFDLLLQKELDRMLGTKGIRFNKFLDIVRRADEQDLRALGASEDQIKDLLIGYDRIANEYLFYLGRLGTLSSGETTLGMEFTEIGLSMVRGASAPIWGITSLSEPLQHLIRGPATVGTIQTIKNIWDGLRIIIGDKRFSTSKALQDELRDSVFFIDLVRSDLQDRIINSDLDGVPKISRWFDRITATREDSRFGLISDSFDVFGNAMVEIGSVRYTTYYARKLAMQVYGKSIAKVINNGAAERFFTALADPNTNATLKRLEEAAALDPKAEAELVKVFKDIARKSGFGDRWDIAMAMNKYGVNTIEKINALKKAFQQLGPRYSKRGLINWAELKELFHENMKQQVIDGVDGTQGMDAFESLMYAAETLTTTRGAISLPRGLNKELRFESRTPLGRLTKALLGWSQSFQNNVIGGYASMGASAYLGSLILYSGLTAATEYLKEWIMGRDVEDIEKEMQRNPETYLFRMMYSLPALGAFNGILSSSLGGVSQLMGGPLKSYGTPVSYPGLNIALNTPYKMFTGFKDLVTDAIPSGDPAKIAAATGELPLIGYNTLLNKSPIAIPARLLVEAGIINEADAMGRYMNLIKKKKNVYTKKSDYTYSKMQGGMPKERKDELLRETLRKTLDQGRSTPNTGVSTDLANLLEDMSNQ